MHAAAVYALFFISGISGLVYQVVWVRVFGNIFGNTVFSAATITAVFLGGLGVGGYLAGRWIDRSYRGDTRVPLRAYGLFELGIAALGLGVALVLPQLESLSSALSSYRVGAEGWNELTRTSYVLRYGVAVLLLTPITLLMGGTLTLLIRHLVSRDLSIAGWRIGVLYGLNTLGAACGAFATDFALVPKLGILGSGLVAVALNAAAGLGALLRVAQLPATSLGALPERPAPRAADADRGRVVFTGVTLFFAGVSAMGLEILWLRVLISVIGGYRAVFSLLLTVMLGGIFAGSLLGGWLNRRFGRPLIFFCIAQAAFVVATLGELALLDLEALGRGFQDFKIDYARSSPFGRNLLQTWYNLRVILDVVALPALLMGCSFPLANAHVQRVESDVGGRAGTLYLANTFGNMVGSLGTGFVLLPFLGSQRSILVLAACTGLSLVALRLSVRGESRPALWGRVPVFAGCLLAVAGSAALWSTLSVNRLVRIPRVAVSKGGDARIVSISEGINETVVVVEVAGIERRLFTNGHSMSSTHLNSQRYMRLFAHLPLLQLEDPRSVLVVCFGVGNTAHAASLHQSLERIEVADLSKNVVRHSILFYPRLLRDPRLHVYINDGRQHLRMRPEHSYDVITLEPPPIAFAGVNALYSKEFYELARSRLRPGGYMAQWLPAYQLPGETVLASIRSFIEVFPNTVLLSGFFRELILLGVDGETLEFDPDHVQARLEAEPGVRADLRRIEVDSLTDLLGTFVAGPETLARATEGVHPVTDDRPAMEHGILAHLHETRLPPKILEPSAVAVWCPRCFEAGEPVAPLAALTGYLAVLESCYRSNGFQVFRSYDPLGELSPRNGALPTGPSVRAALRESRYLRRALGPPCTLGKAGLRGLGPRGP